MITVAIVGMSLAYLIKATPPAANAAPGRIEMTDVKIEAAGGKVAFDLAAVKNARLVYADYKAAGKTVPLLAYVSPSGKMVAAISMCEPCSSTRFHIEGKYLVCNTCGTRWELDSLKGISGGCQKYPPQRLTSESSGDKILVSEADVAGWKPRP